MVLANKLGEIGEAGWDAAQVKTMLTKLFLLFETANHNSRQETQLIDVIRYAAWSQIEKLRQENQPEAAKELLDIMDKYAHEYDYPYTYPDPISGRKYSEAMRNKL